MPTRHEMLLAEYAKALGRAKHLAVEWWDELVENVARSTGTREQAQRQIRTRWPDGPASHPMVIGVLLKYYVACEAVNRKIEIEQAKTPEEEFSKDDLGEEEQEIEEDENTQEDVVYPNVFLVEWLLDDEHDDLADFLGDLSYWPIGADTLAAIRGTT